MNLLLNSSAQLIDFKFFGLGHIAAPVGITCESPIDLCRTRTVTLGTRSQLEEADQSATGMCPHNVHGTGDLKGVIGRCLYLDDVMGWVASRAFYECLTSSHRLPPSPCPRIAPSLRHLSSRWRCQCARAHVPRAS